MERVGANRRALVERFPSQQVYSDRLARIYFRPWEEPADEAAAWEQFVKSSADAGRCLPGAWPRPICAPAIATLAMQAFERCRDFDPMSAEGWFFLGQAYRRGRRRDDALRTFREAVRIDPLAHRQPRRLAGALLAPSDAREALEVNRPGGGA